jgi:hypothetical protein
MADSTFNLVLIVVRKVTNKGAELVGQHVINPYSSLSLVPLVGSLGGKQWNVVFNSVCGMVGVPDSYVLPNHKFERRDISDSKPVITMAHLLCFTGQIADALLEMNKSYTSQAVNDDVMLRSTRLICAFGEFGNPLSAIFNSLMGKINFLHIPAVIPFGKSELDMLEEARKKS